MSRRLLETQQSGISTLKGLKELLNAMFTQEIRENNRLGAQTSQKSRKKVTKEASSNPNHLVTKRAFIPLNTRKT